MLLDDASIPRIQDLRSACIRSSGDATNARHGAGIVRASGATAASAALRRSFSDRRCYGDPSGDETVDAIKAHIVPKLKELDPALAVCRRRWSRERALPSRIALAPTEC